MFCCKGGGSQKEQVEDVEAEALEATKFPYQLGQLSVTILGATGDLAKKETYPALLDLCANGFLPAHAVIVGFGRSDQTSEGFRDYIKPCLEQAITINDKAKAHIPSFLPMLYYFKGSYSSSGDFAKLAEMLAELEKKTKAPNAKETHRMFYFAIPPAAFLSAAKSIKESACSSTGFTRLIVEKPFGHDLASAGSLSSELGKLFPEEQIFRMDHFLGKEILQNLIQIRTFNSFLEPMLDAKHVQNVRVMLQEDFGVEGRGGYFTDNGIIRDVIQNHLFQMLTLVAMDLPEKVIGPAAGKQIRDSKVKVIQDMLPLDPKEVILGQYVGAGGKPGYLEDDSIKPEQQAKAKKTCTFAQLVVRFNSERWKGVPFIIKGGKALHEHKCEIRVQFKLPERAARQECEVPVNELVLHVYPNEAIWYKLNMKTPGLAQKPMQSELDLTYKERYEGVYLPEAYTRLLLDGLRGKSENFVRSDELLGSWKLFSPLLEALEGSGKEPLKYAYGSRGPEEADKMCEKLGVIHNENYHYPEHTEGEVKKGA